MSLHALYVKLPARVGGIFRREPLVSIYQILLGFPAKRLRAIVLEIIKPGTTWFVLGVRKTPPGHQE